MVFNFPLRRMWGRAYCLVVKPETASREIMCPGHAGKTLPRITLIGPLRFDFTNRILIRVTRGSACAQKKSPFIPFSAFRQELERALDSLSHLFCRNGLFVRRCDICSSESLPEHCLYGAEYFPRQFLLFHRILEKHRGG